MTKFAWTKILEVWEYNDKVKKQSEFVTLLRERTLPAILASNNPKKAWDEYVKWLKGNFRDSGSDIETLAKSIEVEVEAKKAKPSELRDLIKSKFLENQSLIETISKDLEKQVEISFNSELPGEGRNLFRQSALSLLTELKSNFKDANKYKVAELGFLSSLLQVIYINDLPDKWQESWELAEPHLKLVNFGEQAKQVVNDFFKMVIHILDDLKPDQEADLDKIQGSLLKESLKLADLVEEERRNELIRIKERLEAKIREVTAKLPLIIKEEVEIVE